MLAVTSYKVKEKGVRLSIPTARSRGSCGANMINAERPTERNFCRPACPIRNSNTQSCRRCAETGKLMERNAQSQLCLDVLGPVNLGGRNTDASGSCSLAGLSPHPFSHCP